MNASNPNWPENRPSRAFTRRAGCLFVWLWLLLAEGLPWTEAAPTPHAWQRWQQTLTSTSTCANPYADVTLRVTCRGPGGRVFDGFGFWDGGNTFRIRCAFPTPGTWRWETACSDSANTGLHHQRGSVRVRPYRGDATLYRRGFLKVADNRRYLAFADGTPLLWMGDTAWAVPHRANDEEWEAYLADRHAKQFTLIQVASAPEWAGETDRQGQRPFTDRACTRWNPAYWQSFENKLGQRLPDAAPARFPGRNRLVAPRTGPRSHPQPA